MVGAFIVILLILGVGFFREVSRSANGRNSSGCSLPAFLVIALIYFCISSDNIILPILILIIFVLVAIISIYVLFNSQKIQQDEDTAKQKFLNELTTQLSQVPKKIELHDNYVWIDDTNFCWCDKTWKGLGKDFTVHRISIDDIDYFIRFSPCSDIDNMPPLDYRLGIIPNCNLFNNYSTKMIFIHDIHGNVIDFHYNDYYKLVDLLPNKSQDKYKELQCRKSLISLMQNTPHKAFSQLAKEINDGNFGIKRDIQMLTLLKKGYCPYTVGKWENGKQIWVYISLQELKHELTLEHSVYELDSFRSDFSKIEELESQSQEIQNNTSPKLKYVNEEIKNYIWKHKHEIIVEAGAEQAFQQWEFKFD